MASGPCCSFNYVPYNTCAPVEHIRGKSNKAAEYSYEPLMASVAAMGPLMTIMVSSMHDHSPLMTQFSALVERAGLS